jgi:hypothetical protein
MANRVVYFEVGAADDRAQTRGAVGDLLGSH